MAEALMRRERIFRMISQISYGLVYRSVRKDWPDLTRFLQAGHKEFAEET